MEADEREVKTPQRRIEHQQGDTEAYPHLRWLNLQEVYVQEMNNDFAEKHCDHHEHC